MSYLSQQNANLTKDRVTRRDLDDINRVRFITSFPLATSQKIYDRMRTILPTERESLEKTDNSQEESLEEDSRTI